MQAEKEKNRELLTKSARIEGAVWIRGELHKSKVSKMHTNFLKLVSVRPIKSI